VNAVFSILEFGACPAGRTVNTEAIQKAIDGCHEAGGGQVVCPAGRYVTGSLLLKSGVELHLAAGCRLIGSERLADYAVMQAKGFITKNMIEGSVQSLIRAVEAEHIAITGPGEIDGSGPAFYEDNQRREKFSKPATPRPRLIMFYRCRRVRVEDIGLIDSPNWTVWLMQCEDVKIDAVRIRGDRRLCNNDGIDIDACRNVTVSNCIFNTEDDCLVLRAIQCVYEAPAVCENVVVSNCVLESSCQGVRIGCPSDGTIRNCVFSNLVINSANNGIVLDNPRVYLWKDTRGSADIYDIGFSNLTVNCVRTPIKVCVEEGIALKRLSGFRFSDITIRSGEPCLIVGNTETVISDVTFSRMTIHTTGKDAIVCRHCRSIRMEGVTLSNGPD